MFSRIKAMIRQVIRKMLPLHTIEQAERIETPLSVDMVNALDVWYKAYCDNAPWVDDDIVKSMNLPAMIASEIARQVTLEMKWNITGKTPEKNENGETPKVVDTPRAIYLRKEFEKLMKDLRKKLEQGCAAGGMVIRPYPRDGHIYFGWTMDWSMYPVSFDDNGNLKDVVFRDIYEDGDIVYTRLERHTVEGETIHITQRAFKSKNKEQLGERIELTQVAQWANLEPDAILNYTDGQMFGWFKVASANNVDVDSPMGISVFHKALKVIQQADIQYSRLLWEFEGSELAIDVDPLALRPEQNAFTGAGEQKMQMPKLNERLFRGVDVGENKYNVFSPAIRDQSLLNGLNRLLIRIEDLTGLSRGTLSDAPQTDARTATELRILRQRTYATIADNQTALEQCLRDVIRVMDKYATIYKLAPEGEYEASFEWDDSILTDRTQELTERLELMTHNVISKPELRQWYTGETKAQAEAAIQSIQQALLNQNLEAMMRQMQVQNAQEAVTDLDNMGSNPIEPPANTESNGAKDDD